jgi:hypothetical protein
MREARQVLPDEGRIVRQRIKDGLCEAGFVHQRMVAGHPDATTETIGSLSDKNGTRNMDHLQETPKFELQ